MFDPISLGLMGVGSAIQGVSSYYGQKAAAKEQSKAINKATRAKERMFNQGLGYNKPYMAAGTRALSQIENGDFTAPQFQYNRMSRLPSVGYNQEQFNFQEDPGYNFRLNQGMNGIENSAAARGSQLSGATLKELQRYGQNFASKEYNNAYGRYAKDRGFNYGVYDDNRINNERRFLNDRNFEYGLSSDNYNRGVNSTNARYKRLSNLVQGGRNSATGLMGSHVSQGNSLSDLAQSQGNINALSAQAPYLAGNTFIKDMGGLYEAYGRRK